MILSTIESIYCKQQKSSTGMGLDYCRNLQMCPTDPAVVLFRVFLPLITFVAVKDSGRKGGSGEVEDPGPVGGGDDLNAQLHPATHAPAGDQYFDGEVKRLLYPLLNILVFVH